MEKTTFNETKPKAFRERIKAHLRNVTDEFQSLNLDVMEVDCPFCLSGKFENDFFIYGIAFVRCVGCSSLYVRSRPTEESLKKFYKLKPTSIVDSELLPQVRQNRIEKTMLPRWQFLQRKLIENNIKFPVSVTMEVGAGIGHFIEVLQKTNFSHHYIAVEPSIECVSELNRLPNTKVYNARIEDISDRLKEKCDFIFINSVIEHPTDVNGFFSNVVSCLRKGGVISLVDMHSGGFDVEILKSETQNITPILIQQIGSIEGIKNLAERHGLETIDLFSIGEMDCEIVYDYAEALTHDHPFSGFKRLLSDSTFREKLQCLLREHKKTGYNAYFLRKNDA